MKAKRSYKVITPYGGVIPILKKIKEFGIPKLIRECLGERKAQTFYGYDDIFIAWILTALCGGKRLDHITKLKKHLSIIPGLKLPSHDTLGRVMKKLSSEKFQPKESIVLKAKKIVLNEYDNNLMMNNMLVKATKKIGALKSGKKYTLHIDATFIETNCFEAFRAEKLSGRERTGFHPMVCLIDDLPVYVCMRNGNSNAKFYLKESLIQCLDILAENQICVDKVISDGAAYDRELINMLHARGIKFNIHTPFNSTFTKMMQKMQESKWRKVEIETGHNFRKCEITEFPYSMSGQTNEFRLIVAKVPNKKGRELSDDDDEKERRKFVDKKMAVLATKNLLKADNKTYLLGQWKEHKNYKYKLIISNDLDMSPEELLIEYNKRGNAERKFDFMKNDFGWRLPPFMKMNQNTVFMIAAALANNVFRGMVELFQEKIPELKSTLRIGKFKSIFIDVICQHVNGIYEFLNPSLDYEKIM